jgi:hypothetical protein
MLRRLSSFLDKAVKQNHALLLYAENNSSNSTMQLAAPYFPQLAPERTDQRHANRPRKLDVLDVFADHFPVFGLKTLQPFAHWLASIIGAVEACRDALQAGSHIA